MNPTTPPPEDREARLTALLLGELSPAEAEALRQELEHDADLRRLHDRLAATLQLVRDAAAVADSEPNPAAGPGSARLAESRREALLAAFKVVPSRPSFWQRWAPAQRRELAAVAAMLLALFLIAGLILPTLTKAKPRAQRRPAFLALIPQESVDEFTATTALPPPPIIPPVPRTPMAEPDRLERESLRVNEPRSGQPRTAGAPIPTTEAGTPLSLARDTGAAVTTDGATATLLAGTAQKLDFSVAQGPAPGGSLPLASAGKLMSSMPSTGDDKSLRFASPLPPAANAPAQPASTPPASRTEAKAERLAELEDRFGRVPGALPAPAAKPDAPGRPQAAEALQRSDQRASIALVDAERVPQDHKGALTKSAPTASAGSGNVNWDTDGDRAKRASDLGGARDGQAPAERQWYFDESGQNGRRQQATQAGQGGFGGGWAGVGGQAQPQNKFFFEKATATQPARREGDADDYFMRPTGQTETATRGNRLALGDQRVPQASTPIDSLSVADQPVPQESESRRKLYRAGTSFGVESTRPAKLGVVTANGTPSPVASDYSTLRADEAPKDTLEKDKKQLPAAPAGEVAAAARPASGPAVPAPVPQPEVSSAENAFSTFSLNVSDVSFKLAAASLDQGRLPEPGSIRTEEFINAFDYRDPEPSGSAPVALAWDRARSPWAHDRDIVRLSVKTAATGRQAGRPLNLVLALDNSGSMERADRVRILQECLRVLATQLRPGDRVSLIAFARTARLVADGLPGERAGDLARQAAQLAPQGGTNLEEALGLAWQTARRHFLPQGVNRVVLLTDGAANLGDFNPSSLRAQVEAQRRQGIALDCFGIGWEGYDDELLEQLSRNGDGRYGFINSPAAATTDFAAQLAGALQVAASDVKVQVEWNPRRVRAWRQIGYARHQLTREQFRDNTVDAAELGAAEAGTALYAVQVDGAGEGPLGTVRVRFKVPGTSDYRELEWSLPHGGAARALEQAPASLRLAATAAAFGEWLAASPHAAEATPDRLLATLRGAPEAWPSDPRPAQLQRMLQQARSLRGQ